MASDPNTSATVPLKASDASLRPAAVLAAVVTVLRIFYLGFICPYNLVEDEAQYWLWSRYLDWSYYSKGPGVAWVIWLSTKIFGNAEWAVRLPTAVLMGIGALAAAGLARDLAVRAWSMSRGGGAAGEPPMATPRRVAVVAALMFILAPELQMVGILMTIDGSYVACWAIAAWAFWKAVEDRSRWAWPALGAAIAAGFLFKYTMLLIVPGLIWYAWVRRERLSLAPGWRLWAAAGLVLGASGLAPVIIWNSQRDWPTVRHLLGHLGVRGGDIPNAPTFGYIEQPDRWSPWWSLELIGQQLAMIGPALLLALIGGWIAARHKAARRRNGKEMDPRWTGQMYLLVCAAPILVFYLIVSLITEPEGNWPVAAYVTLMPLAGWLAADAMEDKRRSLARGEGKPRRTRWRRALWGSAVGFGLCGIVALHFAGVCADVLNRVSDTGPFRSAFRALVGRERQSIQVGRLFGAREMAEHVERLLIDLPRGETRQAPFVLTQHYGRASQMAYYFRTDGAWPEKNAPEVFCAMAYTGGRKSQFDLWEQTRLDRPDLIGRNAVILSNNRPETLVVWQRLFERVEPIPGHTQQLAGEHKPDRVAFIGRGYRGLPGTDGNAAGEMRDGKDAGAATGNKDGR